MSPPVNRRRWAGAVCLALLGSGLVSASAQVRERLRDRLSKKAGGKASGGGDRSLEHGGVRRTYRLHLPGGGRPAKPLPLVIVLHGMGATGAVTEALTGFSALADVNSFAVAYPDGLNKLWRYWAADDPTFIRKLADELVREGVADRSRVYLCGISNGAYLTNVLACDWADGLAAIAPVAGTLSRVKAAQSRPARPLPTLYVHGTEDALVGYDGRDAFSQRELSLSAEELVRWWAEKNGCADRPQVEKLPDKDRDGTTVERHTFSAGRGGASVVFYKVIGGGHSWPGGSVQPEKLLGKTCRDFNASEAMWEFFSKHQLPAKP